MNDMKDKNKQNSDNSPLNKGEDPREVIKKIILVTILTGVIAAGLYFTGIIS